MRVVGIDFGKARIGIALSDMSQTISTPFGTAHVKAKKDFYALAAKEVLRLLSDYLADVERFVVGHPLEMSGKAGPMAKEAERFAEELKKFLDVPITLWDERLTTAQVEKSFKSAGYSRKQRAQASDAAAANLILQSFLDALTK